MHLDQSIVKNSAPKNYKYVFISPTTTLTSIPGGNVELVSVSPIDVITGILIKEGFIRLPELKNELTDETLIVNYGESGRRNAGLGWLTTEVTIQFVSAKSHELICSCTAEGLGGLGRSEADDIREAIIRCLSGLFSEES